MVNRSSYRNEILLLLIFVVVNIVVYLFSIDAAPLVVGADAGQYLRPARSLVDYGEFTMNPPNWIPGMVDSQPFTFGTPLYSILLSIPYYFFGQGEGFYVTVVIIQCSLLYLTGWISRLFLSFFDSKKVLLIHSLIIFNPNSLITAHLIQSETLFALFVVIILLYLFRYIKYGSIANLIVIGLAAGLLALTRPAGLYVVYMIPVILVLILLFRILKNRDNNAVFSDLSSVTVPVLIAFLVMSPWYIRNYINNDQVFLASGSGYYLKDNYLTLVHRGRKDITSKEVNRIYKSKQLKYFKDNGISKECLNNGRDPSCSSKVFDATLDAILNESIETQIRALFHSWGVLYFSGGASNFRNYIGVDGNSLVVDFQQEEFQGLDSIMKLIKRMDTGYLLIFLVFTSYAFITRFIGLIGLYKILKDPKTTIYLIDIVGILVIFTAMYLYLGQSRFRVPLEPVLMLLTVLAFSKKKGPY
jgi:hypothetical protein